MSSRDWDFASIDNGFSTPGPAASAAPAPLSSHDGGVSISAGVTQGKCVVILESSDSYRHLCCAKVGSSGRIACIKPVGECDVDTHSDQRYRNDTYQLDAGIYVKAPGKGETVYTDVVGSIDLMAHHREAILRCEERSVAEYPSLFNDWSNYSTSSTLVNIFRTAKKKAKAMQTPAKLGKVEIDVAALLGAPSVALPDTLEADMQAYQDLWEAMDNMPDSDDIVSPSLRKGFDLGKVLTSFLQVVEGHTEVLTKVAKEVETNRAVLDHSRGQINSRLTDVELSIGNAPSNWLFGGSVWSSLEGMVNMMADSTPKGEFASLKAEVDAHEGELNQIFTGFTNFRSSTEASLRSLSTRMGAGVPSGNPQPAAVPGPMFGAKQAGGFVVTQTMYDGMMATIDELKADRQRYALKIKSLEQKLQANDAAYNLGGTVVRSAADMQAYLKSIGATGIDYGGFCDVYNILIRVSAGITGAGSLSNYTKRQKDASSIGQSEDETVVNYSFQDTAPPIFAGAKSDKSEIEGIVKPEDWKNKSMMSGVGFEIERRVQGVRETVLSTITQNYSAYPNLMIMATSILTTSVSFLTVFVTWVDSSYESLVQGGNSPKDVWQLLSKVIRAFFDEGLGPKRVTPTGSTYSSREEKTAVILWGVLRTHIATEKMLKGDLRDHPIVTGNYAKWLVNHSGKQDAKDLRKEVDKFAKVVTDLKDNMVTKKQLATVEKTAETAKKTADKALNKKGPG